MLDPGKFDTLINITITGKLPPNCVGEQVTEDSYKLGPLWAERFQSLGSREFWAAQQVTDEEVLKTTIHMIHDAQAHRMRVCRLDDGAEFDVISTYYLGRNHQIELRLRRRT
jgi:hypothetical protein